ncbi:MAG TPA: phospholipid carrier-dependent glycosyltransferase [Nostocaceae cyanobacterium]|nr:phospholipid carrier-dependent glycosyltransferase [Nostocaceae cyanobacterium]
MNKTWFRLGMLGIFIFSLGLRFWGLDRFNTLVFDEVYFAKFGNNYLTNTPFFNAHPPLSQYIIGIGIWLASHIPWGQDTVNGLAGSTLTPWSYRWVNALTGSLIPLVVILLTYQLSYRRSFALLAGFFTACDGLFLVESRYALNNIYIVIFGLLGQWLLLLALAKPKPKRWLWLILSGVSFGASAGTKWNGLWFLMGVYGLWCVAWIIRYLQSFDLSSRFSLFPYLRPLIPIVDHPQDYTYSTTPLKNITQINLLELFGYLGIIPAMVYNLIWIPHLQLDRRFNFVSVHEQILGFHLRLGGNSPDIHPYCAAWYKWPLLTRPMAYYYQTTLSFNDPLPVFGPPLPSGTGKIIYDVHALGNPFLWWFGLAALIFLLELLIVNLVVPGVEKQRFFISRNLSINTWIALFLVINYVANLAPWVKVNRCVFIYHYMGAVVFTFIAIAWFVDQCFRSYYNSLRSFGFAITSIIIVAFIFWIPIYLGLPLTQASYQLRMWFNSWI